MAQGKLGKVVTFLLVLAITVGLVAVLSASTRVDPQEAADRYIQHLQAQREEPQGLSAPEAGDPGASWVASTLGFLVLVALMLTVLAIYARARRMEQNRRARRQNRPRRTATMFDLKYRV